jgi:tetratricopeptide (TPR) repeat protein
MSMTSKVKTKIQTPISPGKKRLFYGIMLLIALLFFVILEFSLRLFHYGNELELFIPSKVMPDCFQVNPAVSKRFFSNMKGTETGNDVFLMNKPDTCFRIFVMGCSTTRGFPFQMSATFSRILHQRLQDLYPHTRIEMVNTSMAAINSYAMYDFIDEVLEQKPDLILIYTGHNEYYGAMGVSSVEGGGNVRWLKIMHLKLIRLKTYQLVQQFVKKIAGLFGNDASRPKGTLMTRMAIKNAIEYDSRLYRAGIQQFAANMEVVLKKSHDAGVKVVLGELVSNVSGIAPLISSMPGEHEAVQIFRHARDMEAQGKYSEALELYYQAKDKDAIVFRAPEGMNEVIYDLGSRYENVVVPMKKIFSEHSPNGIPGFNLFTEHLHPNVKGYFLMADAFFNALKENRLIPVIPDTVNILNSADYEKSWGLTELDSLAADIRIRSLMAGWPFQPAEKTNNFLKMYKPASLADSLAFRSVLSTSVKLEDMHTLLAEHYAARGLYYMAYREYASLIRDYPYVQDLYLTGLNYLLQGGEYKLATQLISRMPGWETNFQALAGMGRISLAQGDPAGAVKWFQAARGKAGSANEIQNLLSSLLVAYYRTGDIPSAQSTCKEIWKTNPSFQPMQVLEKKDNMFQAATRQEEFAKLNISAQGLVTKGDTASALQLLKNAEKNFSDNPNLYFTIGSILLIKGDPAAHSYLEKSYSMNPFNPRLSQSLFTYYLKKKDYKNAKAKLEELSRLLTDEAKVERARAYYKSVAGMR